MSQPDVDFIEQCTDRMADGMTFNRTKFEREVRSLVAEVRVWRKAHEKTRPKQQQTGFGGTAFGDLFGGGDK